LRADVDRRRGGWELTFGWVRYADAVLMVTPTQAKKERKDYKACGIVGLTIRALPVRSPLRGELVQVAAKWASEHPEGVRAGTASHIPRCV
jgi:hypothetical protein